MNNQAFIDGQNLRYSTAKADKPWVVDLHRLRVYLLEKYNVNKAYYFIGYQVEGNEDLYNSIQEAGFIIVFRRHAGNMTSAKKGNVDTDIVFSVMRKIADRVKFDKVFLISGDGDYFKMVQYLVGKDRFGKLLAPNKRRMSSLYSKLLNPRFYDYLDKDATKRKLIHRRSR
jgi:uncharacterized LabA/DUF88 family protein